MRVFGLLAGLTFTLAACGQGSTDEAATALPTDPAVTAELRNIFDSHDTNQDGAFTSDELDNFGGSVFAGMDVRRDGQIAPKEWRGYGFFEGVARENGRSDSYEEAKKRTFQRFDADGSGTLSPAELRAGVRGDFAEADRDGEGAGAISFEEFTTARLVRDMAWASAKPS